MLSWLVIQQKLLSGWINKKTFAVLVKVFLFLRMVEVERYNYE